MKKIVLILMLLCCSFLYAQTRTYSVTDGINVCFSEKDCKLYYSYKTRNIYAILPYESSYVMKLRDIQNERVYEYFIFKGFTFYTCRLISDVYKYYKCTVIDTKPNEFTVEMEEIN